MRLEGSCHCGGVRFSVDSHTPVPFNYCYCSICRKTAGGGGYAINIMGEADTLKVKGEENITIYHAVIDGEASPAERRFCGRCGSALWVFDDRWPQWVYPFASAIDTDLPEAPEHVHLMLGSKANWVEPHAGPSDRCFQHYPEESIEEWHKRRGLYQGD